MSLSQLFLPTVSSYSIILTLPKQAVPASLGNWNDNLYPANSIFGGKTTQNLFHETVAKKQLKAVVRQRMENGKYLVDLSFADGNSVLNVLMNKMTTSLNQMAPPAPILGQSVLQPQQFQYIPMMSNVRSAGPLGSVGPLGPPGLSVHAIPFVPHVVAPASQAQLVPLSIPLQPSSVSGGTMLPTHSFSGAQMSIFPHSSSVFSANHGRNAISAQSQPSATYESTEYTHPELQLGYTFFAQVVNMESPDNFYVHDMQRSDEYAEMVEKLKKTYAQDVGRSPRLDIGAPVVVSQENGQVFRCQVLSLSMAIVSLNFVDFGCKDERILQASCKPILRSILDVPVFAIRCCLKNVAASQGRWSKESIELFERFFIQPFAGENSQSDLELKIAGFAFDGRHEIEAYSVDRYTKEKTYLNAEFGKRTGSYRVERPLPLGAEAFVAPEFRSYGTIPVELANQTKSGVIVFVTSPKDFYVQLADLHHSLQNMQDMLQSRYNRFTSKEMALESNELTVGMPVAALYSDGVWYRGMIASNLNPTNATSVTVYFVDYGNVEQVSLEKVKKIMGDLRDMIPMNAIRCGLRDLIPAYGIDWSDDAAETIRDYEGLVLRLRFHGRLIGGQIWQVEANTTNAPEKSIADELCRQGHASYLEFSDDDERILADRAEITDAINYSAIAVDFNQILCGIVTYNGDANDFAIRLHETDDLYMAVLSRMQSIYNGGQLQIPEMISKQYVQCAARAIDDGSRWHRAIFLETLSQDTYKLFFVDLGCVSLVKYGDVRAMLNDKILSQTPALACNLALAGVQPLQGDRWTVEANNLFDV